MAIRFNFKYAKLGPKRTRVWEPVAIAAGNSLLRDRGECAAREQWLTAVSVTLVSPVARGARLQIVCSPVMLSLPPPLLPPPLPLRLFHSVPERNHNQIEKQDIRMARRGLLLLTHRISLIRLEPPHVVGLITAHTF